MSSREIRCPTTLYSPGFLSDSFLSSSSSEGLGDGQLADDVAVADGSAGRQVTDTTPRSAAQSAAFTFQCWAAASMRASRAAAPARKVLVLDWASRSTWEQPLVAEFISSLNRFEH